MRIIAYSNLIFGVYWFRDEREIILAAKPDLGLRKGTEIKIITYHDPMGQGYINFNLLSLQTSINNMENNSGSSQNRTRSFQDRIQSKKKMTEGNPHHHNCSVYKFASEMIVWPYECISVQEWKCW